MPRVSICIPTYKPEYFELALRSALAQTYPDVEIVVSDDCPTDAIQKICDRYSAFVRYERNARPGVLHNLIRCVEVSCGEYIKFLFDDDILSPFCVQYLLEALEATAAHKTVLAFSPRDFIGERNELTGRSSFFEVRGKLNIVPGRDYIRLSALHHQNFIGEFSCVMFRREDCLDENGRFRIFGVEDIVVPDLATWFSLAQRGAFVVHPSTLSYFRRHDNSTSNPAQNSNFIHSIQYYAKLQRDAINLGCLTRAEIAESCRNLAAVYRHWAQSFPQLAAAAQEMDERAGKMAGAGRPGPARPSGGFAAPPAGR